MPILSVRHLTRYRYRKPVAFGEHRMMLRPQEGPDQRLIAYDLRIGPAPAPVRWLNDVHGNAIAVADFPHRAATLEIEAGFTVEQTPTPIPDARGAFAHGGPVLRALAYDGDDARDLARFVQPLHADPSGAVAAFARRFAGPRGEAPLMRLLAQMSGAIREEFVYGRRLVGPPQTPQETLALKSGACRDYALLFMEGARSLGVAARFVSGYVVCAPPKGESAPRLGGGHTHAWAQAYLPELGWVDFDPTNGLVGSAGLVRVATVREPRQACVLSGEYDGEPGDCLGMEVEVEVTEAAESNPVRVAA
jgi:transglutaminase-like putative cysteine protease